MNPAVVIVGFCALLAVTLWLAERIIRDARTRPCAECRTRVPKNATRCGHCGSVLAA